MQGDTEYLVLKFITYFGWCYIGLWWLRPLRQRRLKASLAGGLVRLLLGVAVSKMLPVMVGLSALSRLEAEWVRLLLFCGVSAYVWFVLAHFMLAEKAGELRGSPIKKTGWILGGVVLSAIGN